MLKNPLKSYLADNRGNIEGDILHLGVLAGQSFRGKWPSPKICSACFVFRTRPILQHGGANLVFNLNLPRGGTNIRGRGGCATPNQGLPTFGTAALEKFGKVWKSLEIFGKVWKSLEIFGNLWKR